MKQAAKLVTSFAVLAVLISVAAAHGAGSEAALTKEDMASFTRSGSSSRATPLVPQAPRPTTPESLQLLPNGDFEQGQAVWTVFSLNAWEIIMDSGFPGGVLPYGGSWLAWLGGDDDEVSYIEQELTVPAEAFGLTYWHWIASFDECGFDFAWVKVDGVIVDQYDLCTAADTGTWALYELDISAYAGQTVTLRIQVDTDADLNSNLFVDDVSFDILPIFADGFESGDTSAWSSTTP